MFLHFPCKEFAEESGKTGLRADTPFLPAYHFTQSAAVCQRRIALWVKKIFRAAPHNSARDSSERFCPKIKFGKSRNTVCTRRGYAASVSQLRWQRLRYISSFSNCKIGAKDPLLSADAIVRCCLRKSCGSCPLSHGFQPCQLSQRESQGAGFARPAQRKDNVLPSAQMARQWEFGGAAALGSPFGGAGERSETERAQAVANMGTVRRLQPGTLSVTAFSRASSPKGGAKGRAMPARRTEISAR